ncbi:synaptojanin [Arctopsyche grandis]|uniref:synaptojanin n=1 Tax=Arctopsyche grandis TaxID=121162 RepID=UPI00406D9BAC
MAMSKGFRILEKSAPPQPHSLLVEARGGGGGVAGGALLLESGAAVSLSGSEAEAVRRQYKRAADAYGLLGVLPLAAGDSTLLYLAAVTGCCSIGKVADLEVFRVTQTQLFPLFYQPQGEDRVSEVRKLLNSGTFYFSWGGAGQLHPLFDLTLCAQRRHHTGNTDNRFFWNRALFVHLLRFGIECERWLLKVMCGSVEIRTVYVGARQARAVLVSRLSCERAGTRFNVRGCNDEGNVANFVETEQAIFLDSDVVSYVQTRGSVPLFWEQPGVQVGSHKVKMSRSFGASQTGFERHFSQMKRNYGSVMILNLLGSSLIGGSEGEAMLSNAFQKHLYESCHKDIEQIIFDYHQEVRGGAPAALTKLKSIVEPFYECISLFCYQNGSVRYKQKGTIRTNCLDCLDRTNCVQLFIGLEILNEQLTLLEIGDKKQNVSRFEEVFRQMWVNNGNEISKIYAGTGAIQGGSKIIDGARSAARTIQNNLLDNSKQEAIDILLLGSTLNSELADRTRILLPGNMLHISTPVLREMCRRYNEYVTPMRIRLGIGTYNVNGGKQFRSLVYKDLSLSDWLLDSTESSLVATADNKDLITDIYAIGFEEIVDLNASNIMAASSDNAKAWAEELEKVLSRDRPYVLLSSQQLVGVCLYVFVRPELSQHIRDVAVDSVKTGLGGATGNKGGTAIRMVLHGTSMCFVCAHFAAGQSQVSERNADYSEITRKIAFPMGRTLNSHDYVFWCGDFNYRIDMDKDEIKELVRDGNLQAILEHDQLNKQKNLGNVFKNCFEGDITFPPTYKYDLFSEDYDTSEKCRAPAWTDRILWKSRKSVSEPDTVTEIGIGKLIHYSRAELKQSDHRPVIAIIDVEASQIDTELRQKVFNEVVKDLGPPDATIIITPSEDGEYDETGPFNDTLMAALLQELSSFGEVTLVRFADDNTLWITFREGQSALQAAKNECLTVCSEQLNISLKSPEWWSITQKEIDLCTNNTIPLCAELGLNIPLRKAPPLPIRAPPSPARAPPPRPAPPPAAPPTGPPPPPPVPSRQTQPPPLPPRPS